MSKTATEMLSALESKIGKAELRRQIDALRRDAETGMIQMSVIAAVSRLYQQHMKEMQDEKPLHT